AVRSAGGLYSRLRLEESPLCRAAKRAQAAEPHEEGEAEAPSGAAEVQGATQKKRGWLAPVIAAAVLLVVAGAVGLVALRPQLLDALGITQPTYATSDVEPTYTPGDAVELVRRQYQLLPENTQVAWDNLAESYRQPFPEYEKFWSQYEDVRTDLFEVVQDHPTRFVVRVRVTFVQAGAETAGQYQLVVEPVDGRLRIASSELLL
ncbi:MAG: hypothetical protein HOV94_40175, partial [Saccharothrix sp.]|nr:hypothetical protein [Saccharothrix sp.]